MRVKDIKQMARRDFYKKKVKNDKFNFCYNNKNMRGMKKWQVKVYRKCMMSNYK